MGKQAEGEQEVQVPNPEAELEATESPVEGQTPANDQPAEEGGEEEVIVTIGEEPPPTDEEDDNHAPEWVRGLRKNYRELQRENRELKAKLTTPQPGEPKSSSALGEKPTLEKFDWDTEKYEQALTSWFDQKRKAGEETAATEREAKAAQEAWQAKLDSYTKAKTELKVKDYDEAEAAIQEALSITQQGIILQGAKNPALVVFALGKNRTKVQEFAKITDPVKFAFAVAELELQLKVTPRSKAPPKPESVLRSTGASTTGSVDSTLERLRDEAAKTGDFTKVAAYKRNLRQKT
jgi:hypothetical protein